MKDYAALKTALEDVAYDADVTAKTLRPLLARLNAEHPTEFRTTVVERAEVVAAIGPAIRTMSGDVLQRLRIVLEGEQFDFGNSVLTDELRQIVTDSDARARLIALARRPMLVCEEFGFERMTKEDLWIVLRQISKSHLANPEPPAPEPEVP